MGIFDVFGKKEDKASEKPAQQANALPQPMGKYSEGCTLCGNPGTDKKWAGKFWHTKCLRKGKKMAKGIL